MGKKDGLDIKYFIAEVQEQRKRKRKAVTDDSDDNALGVFGRYAQAISPQWITSTAPWPSAGMLGDLAASATPAVPSIDQAKLESLKLAEPEKLLRPAPDRISVITAWRAWNVRYENGEPRLAALGQSTQWKPKERLKAQCASISGSIQAIYSMDLLPRRPAIRISECSDKSACGAASSKPRTAIVLSMRTRQNCG